MMQFGGALPRGISQYLLIVACLAAHVNVKSYFQSGDGMFTFFMKLVEHLATAGSC